MPINRDLLNQFSAKPKEYSGVEKLIRNIHRDPNLRDWVTLESTALAPVPFKRENNWGILSLLVVPTKLEDGSSGLFAPWGAIEWFGEELGQKIDLRQREDTASLRSSKTLSVHPADAKVTQDAIERSQREKLLFCTLDKLLSTPPNDEVNLDFLASHYAGILPAQVYPYYWMLIPESREWLRPDVSAAIFNSQEPSNQVEIKTTTQEQLEHPTDLSKQIDSWLDKGLQLAKSFSLKEIVSQLQALDARRRLPGFRLAIVGEFSRGKSRLINSLLGRDLLPIGVLPTTATITSIIAGSEDRMEVYPSAGTHAQVRELAESSWSDLLAIDSEGKDREVPAKVRIIINQPWLQALDAELIDTPGAGDLNGRRASLVLDLLSQCDAALLVVSATIPFSMTEAAFLEQEVIGRHIPRILVVVSKLDIIPENERESVLAAIRDRVAQVSAAIPVLPLYPGWGGAEEEALEEVRSHIQAMVAKGDRRAWRSRQVAGQLATQLDNLVEIGYGAITNAKLSYAEREEALRKASQEVQEAEIHWEEMRLELDRRRIEHNQTFQQRILQEKTDLLEVLSLELSKTPNPKFWWERELPFRLRRELLALGRKAENFLMKVLSRDFEWLQSELSRTLKVNITQKATEFESETLRIDQDFSELELANIQRYRLLTRIGSGAAMIGSYLLGGPAAMAIAVSLGTGIFSEKLLDEQLEGQRRAISQELENSVNQAIEEYCSRVGDRFRQLYNQLIQDTKREQTAWSSAKTTAVKITVIESDEIKWQQLIAQSSALKKEILTALEQ